MRQQLFIGGEWVDGEEFIVINRPYGMEKLAEIASASPEQVNSAIKAAKLAQPVMKAMTNLDRAKILTQISEGLQERKTEAAELIAMESAKPFKHALTEIERTIETYKFGAEEAKRLIGEMIPMDAALTGKGRVGYTIKEPLGTIGAITPFNFPQNLVAHKVAPAIAAGNPIVLKPATQTALSALLLAEIISQTDLPAGAFNVVTGNGRQVGDVLVESEEVNMITFTGSTTVGKSILKNAGMKKVSLELGSNAGLIITDSSNLEKIADRCVTGAFSNQGQVCISLQRIYIVEPLYADFIRLFREKTNALKIGDPLSRETDVSAMISLTEQVRALQWIEEAQKQGAELVSGGMIEKEVLQPTILVNVPKEAKLSCQEIFAPVVMVNKVSSLEQAVEEINDSIYGLQAGIFTQKINEAFYAQSHLEVGGVIINDIPTYRVDQMPYGGVKESGNTKEGLKYSIEEMTQSKLVVWNNS